MVGSSLSKHLDDIHEGLCTSDDDKKKKEKKILYFFPLVLTLLPPLHPTQNFDFSELYW